MPYCPSCHSYFRTERLVKNHLSHKFSSCAGYLDQLLIEDDTLNEEAEAETQIELGMQPSLHQSSLQMELGVNDDNMDFTMDNYMQQNDGDNSTNSSTSPMHIDAIASQDFCIIDYPGASATYGQSSTFYEHIQEENQHAEEKAQNIFYPFSSLEDWEVGKWLESLPISMEAKNQFFHLQYVCIIHIFNIHDPISFFRYRKDHYPFPQQEL